MSGKGTMEGEARADFRVGSIAYGEEVDLRGLTRGGN